MNELPEWIEDDPRIGRMVRDDKEDFTGRICGVMRTQSGWAAFAVESLVTPGFRRTGYTEDELTWLDEPV